MLDIWFERTVKPRLKGRAFLIRYADDFVMVFDREERRPTGPGRAAEAIRQVRPDAPPGQDAAGPVPSGPGRDATAATRSDRPGTFDFLGFTHYWGRTLKGNWVVKRKTAKDRFSRSLKSMARWCREHRHVPIQEQWAALTSEAARALRVLRDHRQYGEGLSSFRTT